MAIVFDLVDGTLSLRALLCLVKDRVCERVQLAKEGVLLLPFVPPLPVCLPPLFFEPLFLRKHPFESGVRTALIIDVLLCGRSAVIALRFLAH